MKTVTLVATTLVAYGGRTYGEGMQFDATEEHAAALLKSKQATEAPKKRKGQTAETAPGNVALPK